MEVIEFLRSKGILNNVSNEFIIKFPNDVQFDLVQLLDEFKNNQTKHKRFNRYPQSAKQS